MCRVTGMKEKKCDESDDFEEYISRYYPLAPSVITSVVDPEQMNPMMDHLLQAKPASDVLMAGDTFKLSAELKMPEGLKLSSMTEENAPRSVLEILRSVESRIELEEAVIDKAGRDADGITRSAPKKANQWKRDLENMVNLKLVDDAMYQRVFRRLDVVASRGEVRSINKDCLRLVLSIKTKCKFKLALHPLFHIFLSIFSYSFPCENC